MQSRIPLLNSTSEGTAIEHEAPGKRSALHTTHTVFATLMPGASEWPLVTIPTMNHSAILDTQTRMTVHGTSIAPYVSHFSIAEQENKRPRL